MWICKLREIFRRTAVPLKHQEIFLQKAPFEGKEPGVLNKVYACGCTDQPFTFS